MPAPLLPTVIKHDEEEQQKRKYDIPIPIYALLEKDDRIISVEVINSESGHKDIGVLLFSKEEYAKERKEQFIKERKEDDKLKIFLFGPGDIHKLVFHLEQVKEYANIVVFDIDNKKMAMMLLNGFVLDLKKMLDRIERSISSGICKQISKLHEIDGVKIMSYLCADGSYLAGIYPDGKLYRAKLREEAVDAVIRCELKKEKPGTVT
jgi:hypothetical protein